MSNDKKTWTDRQKRLFHRLMTCTLYWQSHGYQMLRIDLTSAIGADYSKLRYRYKQLRNKIEYELGYKDIENFIIETSEGNGVLHMILAWRPKSAFDNKIFYIPKQWLSDEWSRLHEESYIVSIKKMDCGGQGRNRIARYLVSQYLADQSGALVRYSYSWGRSIGYPISKLWGVFKEYHFKYLGLKRGDLIERWERFIMSEKLEGKHNKTVRLDEVKNVL